MAVGSNRTSVLTIDSAGPAYGSAPCAVPATRQRTGTTIRPVTHHLRPPFTTIFPFPPYSERGNLLRRWPCRPPTVRSACPEKVTFNPLVVGSNPSGPTTTTSLVGFRLERRSPVSPASRSSRQTVYDFCPGCPGCSCQSG
jgi:hypothetical protein